MAADREIMTSIAAHGLPGARAELPDGAPDADDWGRIRSAIRFQRVTGLAVAAADAGSFVLTEQQREELEDEHLQAMGHVLRLERRLVQLGGVLDAAGIRFAVLKGSAVAHLDYPDPALRAFGDNDLLVPGDQFPAAVTALLEAGHRRPVAELRPGFDVRFGKGATLIGGDGHELDLHRTFAMGPFGLLVDLAELWQDLDTFQLGGRTLHALGPEQRLLHACYHALIGNPRGRVLPYRDVAEMVLHGRYDEGRVQVMAEHWGAGAVLARAVAETWHQLQLTQEAPLVAWARRRPTRRREERMLRLYTTGTSYAAQSVASLLVLPTWRDRVDFVRMLAFPGAAYTGSRGRTRLGWLVRGASRAVRLRGESPGSPRG